MSAYAHVRNGSIASFWPCAEQFWSSSDNGHCQKRSACFKGASRGHQHDLFVSLASIHPQRQWARGQRSSFASRVVLTTLGFDADLNQQSCDRAA